MKAGMHITYRITWILRTISLILLISLAFFAAACWDIASLHGKTFLIFLLLILLLPFLPSTNGIWINEKRVIAAAQHGFKVLPYSEISKITISFSDGGVSATIRSRGQDYEFVWSGLFLGGVFSLRSPVCINPKFVTKSIANLSRCEK